MTESVVQYSYIDLSGSLRRLGMRDESTVPSVELERIVCHSLLNNMRTRQSHTLEEVLLYCSKGHGELIVNNQSFTFQVNDIFFMQPNTLYHLIPQRNIDVDYWMIHFNWHNNPRDLLNNGASIAKIRKYAPLVKPLIEGLIRTTDYPQEQFHDFNPQLLSNVMLLIVKELDVRGSEDPLSNYSPKIRQVIEYINANYSQNPSLKTLASLIDLEPTYFARRFYKEVGTPPGQYCLNKRLSKAEILIKNTEIPLQSVSKSVGFRNYNYFSRQFKQKYEQSPKSYRKHNKLTTTPY